MPISRHARMTRTAISPRVAINSRLNTEFGPKSNRYICREIEESLLTSYLVVGTCGRLPRATRPGPRVRHSVEPSVLPPEDVYGDSVAPIVVAGASERSRQRRDVARYRSYG